ncbi:MAG: variant-type mycofactocin precursor [Desulfobacteraceae bacterium]|nr:variant-type mycofactocin precursor [Desulfobacteraceae bacterium]
MKEEIIMQTNEKKIEAPKDREEEMNADCQVDVPPVLEEIVIEELAVDGICGIY